MSPCRTILALCCLFLFLSSILRAQQAEATPRAGDEQLDELLETWVVRDAAGFAIALIDQGELVHSAGYGIAQLEYGIEIGPETIFHVASVSKQFTAMAVILLEIDGKLSLDDEVRTHLPWVPDFGVPITLRHLIHHTSGLRDQWESLVIAGWRLDDVITRDHIVEVVKHQRELNFPPGERHLYCNTGYTLLGEVVAAISGKTFPEFCEERIFEPLGMSSTHFHDDHEHLVPNRAYSYQGYGDGSRKSVLSYANAGATSLFTTAEDLVRWLENFEHHRVGGIEAFELIRQRGVLNDGKELGYAGGVMLGRYRGFETISHSGGDAGFRSHVVWFPEAQLGIAVVSNHPGHAVQNLANQVADLRLPEAKPVDARLVEEEKAPPDETPAIVRSEEPSPRAEPIEVPRERLESYVGNWTIPGGFTVTLTRRLSRLYVQTEGATRRRLIPASATRFRSRIGDIEIDVADGDDPPTELELRLDDRSFVLTRCGEGEAPPPDLAALAGRYECPELETVYTIEAKGDVLLLRHFRHGAIEVKPNWPDTFSSDQWYLKRLRFTRDENGAVDGFRWDGGRVLNLRFDKVSGR